MGRDLQTHPLSAQFVIKRHHMFLLIHPLFVKGLLIVIITYDRFPRA